MTAPDWPTYLESMAQSIARQRLSLSDESADADIDAVPFEPPMHLGPLPLSQEQSARAVLRELDDLQHMLAERRDRTGRQLQLQRRLRTNSTPSTGSVYVNRQD